MANIETKRSAIEDLEEAAAKLPPLPDISLSRIYLDRGDPASLLHVTGVSKPIRSPFSESHTQRVAVLSEVRPPDNHVIGDVSECAYAVLARPATLEEVLRKRKSSGVGRLSVGGCFELLEVRFEAPGEILVAETGIVSSYVSPGI